MVGKVQSMNEDSLIEEEQKRWMDVLCERWQVWLDRYLVIVEMALNREVAKENVDMFGRLQINCNKARRMREARD